jgi:ribokinase
VIVVIGSPSYRPPEGVAADGVGGLGAAIAGAAAGAGAAVQFVGKVGDDAAGDALVLALARDGIGHVAILRDASHPTPILVASVAGEQTDDTSIEVDAFVSAADETTDLEPAAVTLPAEIDARPRLEPADLELALRYLTDFAVIVAADPLDEASAGVLGAAASYAGAQVVAIVPPGDRPAAALMSATVLEGPADDPDGAFAQVVADYATALDAGTPPGDAFRRVVASDGWEVATT